VLNLKDIKIIVSGLDNAGKTSILMALDKRYDFEQELIELQPTIKVNYHKIKFLGNTVIFWDMGGQERYRQLYKSKHDIFFGGTNLLLFLIDIQDAERYELSLEYLNEILKFFEEFEVDVPLLVTFHKLDPKLEDDEKIHHYVRKLTEKLFSLKQLKMLFLQTSIYNIFSIIHLISSALSFFDDKYTELKELFKETLNTFECKSLILFDQNGIILSEYYTDTLDFNMYQELLKSVTEHIVLLKKIQDENYNHDYDFRSVNTHLISYLQRFKIKSETFYISALIDNQAKEKLLEKVPDIIKEISNHLESIIS